MKDKIVNRLVSVKSIVTITLTLMFAVLSFVGKLDQNFMMIYTVIVSFYFGTQTQKTEIVTPATDGDTKDSQPAGPSIVSITLPEDAAAKIADLIQTSAAMELKPANEEESV